MQQERDYIQREIQRLTLLLTKLIGKALELKTDDFEQGFHNIESDLKNEFDLTLSDISEMEDSELSEKLDGLDEQHLEKLVELIAHLVHNLEVAFRIKLAKKGIVMLDFLDANSKTFSLNRIELRNKLLQQL
ncbi:hypothetical protein [uncultured Croceitalea sp.]|uniref:hypothetical protein n=1 Tax=uncultured Croceitalea sp. TaxID=1798908 RepID=UPI0033063BB2